MAKGYWYLGSPYSKYPDGLDAAFRRVCWVAAKFAEKGIPAYSPIAHTHPIAVAGALDPYDHKIWLPFDHPMMEAARGLVVVMMEGYKESYGLKCEIEYFLAAGKPVVYYHPDDYHYDWETLR